MIRLLAVFGAEALLFLVITLNYRACAKGWVKSTVATDAIIAGLNFSLIKWIAETGTLGEHGAYIAGGAVGSWIGMRITRHWRDIDDHSPRLEVKKNHDWGVPLAGGTLVECPLPTPSNYVISSGKSTRKTDHPLRNL